MARTILNGVAIRAMGGSIPADVRSNDAIGGPDDRLYVDRISATVGVRERRIVRPSQFGSDLAVAAARSVLSATGWDAQTIDLVVVGTQTPDRLFPGISFQVHRQLGLSQACSVFDVNLGCSAFTHGLWIAADLLPGIGSRALLVNVDTMSRTLGAGDLGNQVLFGDGAGATALEVDPGASPLAVVLSSDGRGTESVCLPHSGMSASSDTAPEFVINGPAVLALALRSVPRIMAELLEVTGLSAADIGLFVPHQANGFILEKLTERLDLDPSRVLIAMAGLGNTSSASIPLAICSSRARVETLDRRHVVMIGFGTGFSLSGVLADLTGTVIADPVEVS